VSQRRFLVLSGPNLDRLGRREPGIYGTQTLADIHAALAAQAETLGVAVEARQSNHEGSLIDWIGAAEEEGFAGIAINPGAYTHTSWALHDSIAAREEFRRHSCVAPACTGTIAGFGARSYLLALDALVALSESSAKKPTKRSAKKPTKLKRKP
jgi:3-dehydroquinate dehydratase-2